MQGLQTLVETYLQSENFSLLEAKEGFIVADKMGIGGDRDTRLLWIPPPPVLVDDFSRLQDHLLVDFETLVPQYPDARCFIVVETLEGLTPDFRREAARRYRVKIRTAIQFFDAPFRTDPLEESEAVRKAASQVQSAIAPLRDLTRLRKRVPQPYSVLADEQPVDSGDDLLIHLRDELMTTGHGRPKGSCLRIVVGAAGAGKSVLFQSLFALLYRHFLDQKGRQLVCPRPMPFTPEHLRRASAVRVEAVIDSFCRTEVAAPVTEETFKWMLASGLSMWLFDGLDELYTGDSDFFEFLLDPLTSPECRADIVVFARDSLLRTSETFISFLDEFQPGATSEIRIYRLNNWGLESKRSFASISLEGRRPEKGQPVSGPVSEFLDIVTQSESLKSLSSLPYYCNLLLEEFEQGTLPTFTNDFDLIDHAVSRLVRREEEKGLLLPTHLEPGGLNDWIETVAVAFYEEDFKGITRADVEEYAQAVLRDELSPDERRHTLTTLIQFPVFAAGAEPGAISFKHELVAEYLAGRYLLKQIAEYPRDVARSLSGARIDFADSLIARYLASKLVSESGGLAAVVEALKGDVLPGRAFANLLQVLLLSTPNRDVVKSNKIELECRDLKRMQFKRKDLTGVSFRNCDLSGVTFESCDLQGAQFEGAILFGTRFEKLTEAALRNARFGSLERFEFIYMGKQKIDDINKMREWVQQTTGDSEKIQAPCPAARQLRRLFQKFVHADGSARRYELSENALGKGKRYPGAPSLKSCVGACLRFGYLEGPDYRNRYRRAPGDRYSDMVCFVRDWIVNKDMRLLLNSVCDVRGCAHIPGAC